MQTQMPSGLPRRLGGNRWLAGAIIVAALVTVGAPTRFKHRLVEHRCANACGTYMRGLRISVCHIHPSPLFQGQSWFSALS